MKQEVKLGFEIRTLDNMMRKNFVSAVRERNLDEMTIMHGWIIGYLYRHRDQEIYQKDIEASFSIGRSTVTGILQLMEKKGYLVRESVRSDARLKSLKLTETGIKLHEDAEHLLDMLDQEVCTDISGEEMEVFYRVIEHLKENLRKQEMERKDRSKEAQND